VRWVGWRLVEFNGERDHVHLLITLPPNLELSRLVNNRKTASSRRLRNEFADELRAYDWKPFYGVVPPGLYPAAVLRSRSSGSTSSSRNDQGKRASRAGILHLQPGRCAPLAGALDALL
jgi:hypothetical protein